MRLFKFETIWWSCSVDLHWFSGEFVKQWVGILTMAKSLWIRPSSVSNNVVSAMFVLGCYSLMFKEVHQPVTSLDTLDTSSFLHKFGPHLDEIEIYRLKYAIAGQEVFSWEQRAKFRRQALPDSDVSQFLQGFSKMRKVFLAKQVGMLFLVVSTVSDFSIFSQGCHNLPHYAKFVQRFDLI